jgi:hypothetical protein
METLAKRQKPRVRGVNLDASAKADQAECARSECGRGLWWLGSGRRPTQCWEHARKPVEWTRSTALVPVPRNRSARDRREKRKQQGEERGTAAALYLEPLETAIWYALLGETDEAASRAAKIATAGRKPAADEKAIKELIRLAKSPDFELARAGSSAFGGKLAGFCLLLILIASVKNADRIPPQNLLFSARQAQEIFKGFGGSLSGYTKVSLDLEKLLGLREVQDA